MSERSVADVIGVTAAEDLGVDPYMSVETLRARLLWGKRVEHYQPKIEGESTAPMQGPPGLWYLNFLHFLRQKSIPTLDSLP